MDFNKWIYPKDIAEWFSKKASSDIGAKIDCICNAPHRTLKEKTGRLKGIAVRN